MAGFPDSTQVTTSSAPERPVILIGDTVATLVTREAPSEPVQVTTHPIEFGEEIADYAIELTKTLVLECKFLSDRVPDGVNVDQFSRANGGRRPMTWQEKRDAILADKAAVRIMDVFTGYALYEDMVLTDYVLDRRPQTTDSWTVQLFFQHVSLITPQWSSVPIERIPADKRTDKLKKGSEKGAGKTDGGERPGEYVGEAAEVVADSTWVGARVLLDSVL